METINDIIYELNGNPKTKALAKRIELARINDEQRWRKDIADTRRLTAERMMEGIEFNEKALREALEELICGWDIFINGLEEDLDGHYPAHYQARRSDYEKRIHKAKAVLAASPKTIGNGAKMRETDDWRSQLERLINGEVSHYMAQGTDYLWVIDGPWSIKYDNTKGEDNETT